MIWEPDLEELSVGRAPLGVECSVCGAWHHRDDIADPEEYAGEWRDWLEAKARLGEYVCCFCADETGVCEDCRKVTPHDAMCAGLCEDCATPDRVDPLGARTDRAWEASQ